MQVVKLYMQVVTRLSSSDKRQGISMRNRSRSPNDWLCSVRSGGCAMNKMGLTQRGFLQTTNLLAAGTMYLDEAALAGLAESPFSIQSTQVKRVRFKSRRSFDEVLQRLHQLVPAAITPEQYPAAMMKAGGVSLESFEKVVRSQTEQSGFMLFAEFDYHQWLGLYGIQRKLARWILGNPVIAITMIRHDLEAALSATELIGAPIAPWRAGGIQPPA